MVTGIYKITNTLNGKIYIGQSIDIPKRIYEHKYKAFCKEDRSYKSAIHNAFRKYGLDNFKFEILEETKIEELDEKEIYYIEKYNSLYPNGYNILKGGQLYRPKTNKTNKKCKKCEKCGKEVSNNSILCLDCYKLDKAKNIPSKEILEDLLKEHNNYTKISKIFNVSPNTVKKWCNKYELSIIKIKKEKPNKKRLEKPVAQIDIETNEIIATFKSTIEAAKSLGKKKSSHIIEVCKGKLKAAYGYKWKYMQDDG